MLKRIIKLASVSLLAFLSVFIFLELAFRASFPEFVNDLRSESLTSGKKTFYGDLMGFRVRIPFNHYSFGVDKNTQVILILGDSISYGYGTAYEDIYWRKLERMLNLYYGSFRIVHIGSFGSNVADSLSNLGSFLRRRKDHLDVKMVIYQFNFNDIMPFNSKDLEEGKHLKEILSFLNLRKIYQTNFFKTFLAWRYEHLNKSVFLRVSQHYASILVRNRYGSCEERGFDALGEYTWAFGSKKFGLESEELWRSFISSLEQLTSLCKKQNAKFVLFISPILFDIDTRGYHPHYNSFNLDFRCATIDPRERLLDLSRRLDFDIIDPKDYVRIHFERRIREGNFEPFYFPADTNHFTPVASNYVAEYVFFELLPMMASLKTARGERQFFSAQ